MYADEFEPGSEAYWDAQYSDGGDYQQSFEWVADPGPGARRPRAAGHVERSRSQFLFQLAGASNGFNCVGCAFLAGQICLYQCFYCIEGCYGH